MNAVLINALLRHLLTFFGGYLANNGVINENEVNTGTGAIVALVGIIWSAIDKKKRQSRLP